MDFLSVYITIDKRMRDVNNINFSIFIFIPKVHQLFLKQDPFPNKHKDQAIPLYFKVICKNYAN